MLPPEAKLGCPGRCVHMEREREGGGGGKREGGGWCLQYMQRVSRCWEGPASPLGCDSELDSF